MPLEQVSYWFPVRQEMQLDPRGAVTLLHTTRRRHARSDRRCRRSHPRRTTPADKAVPAACWGRLRHARRGRNRRLRGTRWLPLNARDQLSHTRHLLVIKPPSPKHRIKRLAVGEEIRHRHWPRSVTRARKTVFAERRGGGGQENDQSAKTRLALKIAIFGSRPFSGLARYDLIG